MCSELKLVRVNDDEIRLADDITNPLDDSLKCAEQV
jgi:hypothetical protein